MSAEKTARSGIKWPVCTMLLVVGLGAMGYFTYTKFLEERAAGPAAPAVSAPAQISPAQNTPARGAVEPSAGEQAYRTVFPFYFLIAFAGVMTAILGTILYLWWSLKDWEGGKKYGDEETAKKE